MIEWIKRRKENITWSSVFLLLVVFTIEHLAYRGSLVAQVIWDVFIAFFGTCFLYAGYRLIKAFYVGFLT